MSGSRQSSVHSFSLSIRSHRLASRQEPNRVLNGEPLCGAVLRALKSSTSTSGAGDASALSRECANCALNLCYERANVVRLLVRIGALAAVLPQSMGRVT